MPPRSSSSGGRGVELYRSYSDDSAATTGSYYDEPELPTGRLVSKQAIHRGSRPLTKSVRWNDERNTVLPIPHLNDLSDNEIAQIWYEAKEYSEIKSSYQMTIFMMESGELKEDDEHTGRGLEYRTQQGAWARYENKRDAYNAVLDEQDRQWKIDKDDHDEIARVYLEHSTKCAIAAANRGDDDAKIAKDICQDILRKRRKIRRKKSKGDSKSLKHDAEKAAAQHGHHHNHVDQMCEALREQSFSRRGQIRDDIEKQQATKQALKKDKRQAVAV